MAQQTIGVGTTANDGTGDSLRTAGGKINSNFTELYNVATKHAARASRVTNLALAANDQLVTFTTEDYDTDGLFTIGTSDTKLVIPSGWATVAVKAYLRLSTSVTQFINIKKNGSFLTAADGIPEVGGSLQSATIVSDDYLAVSPGDYLELNSFTTGARTVSAAWFSVRRTS